MDAMEGIIIADIGPASPQTIIIVDDKDYMRDLHSDFCNEVFPGVKLLQFYDGSDAWDALQCGTIAVSPGDILITDHDMPEMSGLDLAKNIKNARLPLIVAMFSGNRCVDRSMAREAGIAVFQEKPEIMQLYRNLISSKAMQCQ